MLESGITSVASSSGWAWVCMSTLACKSEYGGSGALCVLWVAGASLAKERMESSGMGSSKTGAFCRRGLATTATAKAAKSRERNEKRVRSRIECLF